MQCQIAGLIAASQDLTNAEAEHSLGGSKTVARPKPWDGKGDLAAARHFLVAFSNWAMSQKEKMNDPHIGAPGHFLCQDIDWIQAALNLMEGDTRTWVLPALEKMGKGTVPYNCDWDDFMEEFTWWFIPLDPAEAAREAIKKLRQGNHSVAEYKARFDEHSGLTGWSQVDLRTRFYDGLSDAIKDALAISDRPIQTLSLLVDAAQVLDTRLRQRKAEKKGQTFHNTQGQARDPMAMDIDASRQQASKPQQKQGEEKRTRQTFLKVMKGRCFGCGSKDHSKADGGHEKETCHHCQKPGHRQNVCFDRYIGRDKKASANATTTASTPAKPADSAPAAKAAASIKPKQDDATKKQIKELQKQIEALKASF